jgi:hypothetical protein
VLAALALLATLWIGPAAGAAVTARTPTPAPVKYFVVPARANGPATLFEIAAQTLGDGSRFMQIFRLNKGRLQPNGGRLENPRIIEPGWVLELPSEARGPGVHFGPLPQPTASASAAPPSRPPARPADASSSSAVDVLVSILALVAAGALAVVGARLARRPRRGRRRAAERGRERRHDRLGQPRMPSAARAARPSALADTADPAYSFSPPSMATPASWPADHPSRPQRAVDYRDWPADHPSRPQQAVDYRDWPADHPSRPQQAVDYRRWPDRGPAGPQGWIGSGQPVPAAPVGFGNAALNQPVSAPQPRHSRTSPPSFAPAYGPAVQARAQDLERTEDLEHTDALRVASLLLSEAGVEADRIRAEAAAYREQAAMQAVSVREAAEQEAEKLRVSLQAMSAELSQVAAFVTRTLEFPAEPGTSSQPDAAAPESWAQATPTTSARTPASSARTPATPARTASAGRLQGSPRASEPEARTTTKPDNVPSRERGTRRRTSPGPAPKASPAAKPGERPRQIRAARIVVAAFIGLSLLGAVTGTAELFLHGFPFFVFRSAGTGGTPSNGRQEDQGPGQPDAPGARHHAAPRHHPNSHQPAARSHAGRSTH